MSVLPSSRQEWFTSLLRPFKAYAFIGIWIFAIGGGLGSYGLAAAAVFLYWISVPILIVGGLIQLAFRPRKAAITTFLFAAADTLICAELITYFHTA